MPQPTPRSRPVLDPRTQRRVDEACRVRDLLRSSIVYDEFASKVLPSEPELMLAYTASRQVVRDALAMLKDEGLIRRVQGNGTFVQVSKFHHNYDHLHGPGGGLEVRHRLLHSEVIQAPAMVADRLTLPAGSQCGLVEYATSWGDSPYGVCTAYVPAELLTFLQHPETVSEWWLLFEQAGIEIGVTDVRTEAAVADPAVAGRLEIAPGAAVLLTERLLHDAQGRPIEFGISRIRGDRLALSLQIHRRPRPTRPEEDA